MKTHDSWLWLILRTAFLERRIFALALASWLLPALCAAQATQVWDLRVDIGDGSTPPDGVALTYGALCFYTLPAPAEPALDWGWADLDHLHWYKQCGADLPIGTEVQITVEKSPYKIMAAPGPDLAQYYFDNFSYTGCFSSSPCASNTQVHLYAKAGSIEGFVRFASDRTTPIPDVVVAAYNLEGGLVATAVTDQNGHYQFIRVGASDFEIENHWALNVDHIMVWYNDSYYAPDSFYKDFRVLASPLGVGTHAAYVATEPWTTVYPSALARKDFYLGSPEGKKHDPDEKSGEEDTPEGRPPECPSDDPCCKAPHSAGKPVTLATGSVHFEQTDAVIGAIRGNRAFTRRYNSKRAFNELGGVFGRGWEHSLEKSVTEAAPGSLLRLDAGTSGPLYFQDMDGDGTFRPVVPLTEQSWIVAAGDAYVRHFRFGGAETYDNAGRLTTQTDRVGNTTSLSRDGLGRLTSIVFPGGRTLALTYDGERVVSLSGPVGTLAAYSYSPEGFLLRVEYASGAGYTFTYDPQGQILRVADLSGRPIETHTYSGDRALTSETADGRDKLTFTYGSNATTVTDALGVASSYVFAEVAGLDRVFDATTSCSSCGPKQHWTYDALGRITEREFGEGGPTQRTSYTYDANDNFASVTLPLGRTTSYTYDAEGRMLTRLGPDGALNTWTHGPAGPLAITDPLNRTTTIGYSPTGLVTSITNPEGETTTFTHNGFGDLASLTDPASNTTTFGHDELGRRTSVTDPLSRTTAITYDSTGNVTRITAPDSTHTDFAYDGGGRRQSLTDASGRVTRYGYDPYGRLKTVQDPAGDTTRYDYDALSRLAAITDARGNATGFTYNNLGRVTQLTYPGGASESYSYDAAGRLTAKTDRRGVLTTYEYDAADRLTRLSFSDGTPAKNFTYDAADRLLSAQNGADTLSWTYDVAGQLLSEASSRNGTTVAYGYDAAGRRLSVALDAAPVGSYGYDAASRLVTLTSGSRVFTFSYDVANQRTMMNAPNGIVTSYAYDPLGRLTSLQAVLGGSTTIAGFTYTYNATGNRTTKASPDFTEAYSYDPLDRLTAVERSGTLSGRSHFRYDSVGNRTTTQINNMVTSAVHNGLNQLLSSSGGGPLRVRGVLDEPGTARVNGQPAQMLSGDTFEATIASAPGSNSFTVEATDGSGNVRTQTYEADVPAQESSYAYDSNGYLTTKVEGTDSWAYEWNAQNQLTRVTKNSIEQARFSYDPAGRRVEKVAGGVTTSYTYDGEDILREVRGASTLKYVHGPGIDEPLAREDGSGVLTYFHTDGLGSVVKRTDQAGAVVHEYRYDAWGNIETGATEPGYAFTGREWDPETGLYYYRARYYDPKIGRFISEDPLPIEARPFEELNNYAYVANNPVNFIDPAGLQACIILGRIPPLIDPFMIGGRQLPTTRLPPSMTRPPNAPPGPRVTPPRPYTPVQQPLPPIPVTQPPPWWMRLLEQILSPFEGPQGVVPVAPKTENCQCA